MQSVHLEAGVVSVRAARRARRPRGYARLRLITGGICNTDLELQRGYYGFRGTPGHEFVAEVVEADSPRWTGRRVVGEINLACRRCDWCAQGWGRHCPRRTVLGIVKHPGAFQEYFTLPEENLFEVPARVPTDHAVFTEPLAAACEILDQVKITRGEPVAVLGDGKLGLLIGQVLLAHGADVHQFGRHRNKLALAEARGAKVSLTPPAQPTFAKVVDATGSAEGLRQAVGMTRPRGTVVMKSTVAARVELDTAAVIVPEITLIGSRCGRFAPALDLLRRGQVDVAPLIAARYPLRQATAAFARAAQKGMLKVLLDA
jgi:alcohol dehydrogenase